MCPADAPMVGIWGANCGGFPSPQANGKAVSPPFVARHVLRLSCFAAAIALPPRTVEA